jgi:hypothetical protein
MTPRKVNRLAVLVQDMSAKLVQRRATICARARGCNKPECFRSFRMSNQDRPVWHGMHLHHRPSGKIPMQGGNAHSPVPSVCRVLSSVRHARSSARRMPAGRDSLLGAECPAHYLENPMLAAIGQIAVRFQFSHSLQPQHHNVHSTISNQWAQGPFESTSFCQDRENVIQLVTACKYKAGEEKEKTNPRDCNDSIGHCTLRNVHMKTKSLVSIEAA